MSDDHRIRERAHQIWEQAGRPDGQHEEHWAQAMRESGPMDGQASIDGEGAAGSGQASGDGGGMDSPTMNAPDSGGASPGEAAAAMKALNDGARGTGGRARRR